MLENNGAQSLRNARACETCRASKSRCIFRGQQTICQRCERAGVKCDVRAKARPLRTRGARPPVTLQKPNPPTPSSAEFTLSLPAIHSPKDVREDVEALSVHHQDLFGDDSPQDTKVFLEVPPPARSCGAPTPLEQRKLTLGDAERLLDAFRKISPFFPFVQVSKEATVSSLSKSSPFLLLTILTIASISSPRLYRQLDHEFKRLLSAKVIVEGRKSLDFLQGILVYIAWYPIAFNPKTNQSLMYKNLAASLVTDLGLDQELPKSHNFSAISTEGLVDGGEFTQAAKHAYLGAYYLSNCLSVGFQRPNTLPYQERMAFHTQNPTSDNTEAVYSIVKLERLIERIADLHATKNTAPDTHTGAFHAELNIQIFQNELQEWRNSTSPEVQNLPVVGLAERYIDVAVYSYELGFLRRSYRNRANVGGRTPSTTSQLFNCLSTSKRFFEYLLSLPESSYRSFTTAQITLMVQAILTLSRLTFLMARHLDWDATTTRSSIPLVMYLDCLCYRFQELSPSLSTDSDIPPDPDCFFVFKMILGSVKKSYEKRMADIQPRPLFSGHGNSGPTLTGHCPMLDPGLGPLFRSMEDSMSEDSYGFTPPSEDSGMASACSTTPLYHDLWATMTCSWADNVDD